MACIGALLCSGPWCRANVMRSRLGISTTAWHLVFRSFGQRLLVQRMMNATIEAAGAVLLEVSVRSTQCRLAVICRLKHDLGCMCILLIVLCLRGHAVGSFGVDFTPP